MVPCSQLTPEELKNYDYISNSSYVHENMLTYSICSRTNSTYAVRGKPTDTSYEYVGVIIGPCIMGSKCKSKAEIKVSSIQLLLPTSSLNQSDVQNPRKLNIGGEENHYPTLGLKQTYNAKMHLLQIWDYIGYLPEWQMRDQFYEIDSKNTFLATRDEDLITCTAEDALSSDAGRCTPYIEFLFQSSGITISLQRKYKTLFETLGSIGGTNSLVYLVIILIYRPINKRQRTTHLLSKVFPIICKENLPEKYEEYLDQKETSEKSTEKPKSQPESGFNETTITKLPNKDLMMSPKEPNDSTSKEILLKEMKFDFIEPRVNLEEPIKKDLQRDISPNISKLMLPTIAIIEPTTEQTKLNSRINSTDKKSKLEIKPKVPLRLPNPFSILLYKKPESGQSDVKKEFRKRQSVARAFIGALTADPATKTSKAGAVEQPKPEADPSFLARVFCCKKTQKQIDQKKQRDSLYKRVEESIDVITMVRDFNYLKILVHFMLNKDHINSAQLVGIELWKKEQRIKNSIKKSIKEQMATGDWKKQFDKESSSTLIDNLLEYERCLNAITHLKKQGDHPATHHGADAHGHQQKHSHARKMIREDMTAFYNKHIKIEDHHEEETELNRAISVKSQRHTVRFYPGSKTRDPEDATSPHKQDAVDDDDEDDEEPKEVKPETKEVRSEPKQMKPETKEVKPESVKPVKEAPPNEKVDKSYESYDVNNPSSSEDSQEGDPEASDKRKAETSLAEGSLGFGGQALGHKRQQRAFSFLDTKLGDPKQGKQGSTDKTDTPTLLFEHKSTPSVVRPVQEGIGGPPI